jgi:hypothetical protein
MTRESRIESLCTLGFTARQAAFVVAVMTHSGVCLPRQFAAFAGVAYGHKVNRFFERMVARGIASACPSLHNRALVFHVQHRGLYEAIGEPHSRFRRPVPANAVAPRLLVLDAVVGAPEVTWLPTAGEKAEHFVTLLHVPAEHLPSKRCQEDGGWASGLFPDALPVGIDAADRVLFVHPVSPVSLEGFGPFLRRHRALLASLSAWTLRLVVSPEGRSEEALWQAVVAREIGSLLHHPDHAERRVDWHVLPYRYGHLSPLVDQAHRVRLRARQGAREGEHRSARPQALQRTSPRHRGAQPPGTSRTGPGRAPARLMPAATIASIARCSASR